MSVSIKQHEIQKFIQESLAPRFNTEWTPYRKDALIRQSDYLLQGVSLYRFSHSKTFRVYYFLQLLVILDEHLHVTLGGTLQERERSRLRSWLEGEPREAWFEWESRYESLDYLIELLHEQARPDVRAPLTLESAAPVIAKRAAGSSHWLVLWSDAMMKALSGDLDAATDEMIVVRDLLLREKNGYEGASREVPAWIFLRQQNLETAIDALADEDRFRRYCEETSRATTVALGLPG